MKFSHWVLSLTLCACFPAQAQSPAVQKRFDAELLASDGQANAGFGASAAIDGNIVAVANGENPGSVYLFSRLSKGTVTQIAKLSASDGAGLFAVAVGENGRLVVAGAPRETIGHNANQGAVYVFLEPEGGWTGDLMETAKLTASDGGANDELGVSVSTTNGVIVAGSYRGGGQGQGEAYVYVEPKGGWANGTETARLKASNGQTGDAFGGSVAVYGPRVVVGADGFNDDEGIAYVFQEPVGGWKNMTETAQLSHPGTGEFLGFSVAVLGKTVVVGAPSINSGGAAYIYIQPPNGWVSTGTPSATLTEANSKCLGDGVAIGSAMIALGDACVRYGHPVRFTGDSVVYRMPKYGWKDSSDGIVLRPKGGQQNSVVAVGKDRVIVGSPETTVGDNSFQGAAFIFTVPTTK